MVKIHVLDVYWTLVVRDYATTVVRLCVYVTPLGRQFIIEQNPQRPPFVLWRNAGRVEEFI
jgi:hypothetical protein